MKIFMMMFIISLLSFCLARKHLLLMLISLEFIVISLLILIISYCIMFNHSFYIYLLMMTFYVCESVLGLSILVYLIRCHGNDYLGSLFLW